MRRLWFDDDNVSIYTTLNNLGQTHYKNKDLDQALKSYRELLYLQMKRLLGHQYDQLMGPDLLSTTCEVIEEIQIDKADLDLALEVYNLTLAARKAQSICDNPAIAGTAETIDMLQFKKDNHDAVMSAFHEALG
eukprot:6640538-Ditylum_brightwellii.AAC.1